MAFQCTLHDCMPITALVVAAGCFGILMLSAVRRYKLAAAFAALAVIIAFLGQRGSGLITVSPLLAALGGALLSSRVHPTLITLLYPAAGGLEIAARGELKGLVDLLGLADELLRSGLVLSAAIFLLWLAPYSRPSRIFSWQHLCFALAVGGSSLVLLVVQPQAATGIALTAVAPHLLAIATGLILRREAADAAGVLTSSMQGTSSKKADFRRSRLPAELKQLLVEARRHAARIGRSESAKVTLISDLKARNERAEIRIRAEQIAKTRYAAALTKVTAKEKTLSLRMASIAELMPEPLVILDPDRQIVFANEAASKAFKISKDALTGSSASMLIPPFALDHPLSLGQDTADTGTFDILCGDGAERSFRVDSRTVQAGQATEHVFLFRAPEATDDAEHSDRSAEALAALSHELRTPLHGLIATLDMLNDEQLTPEGVRQLAIAKASAKSLLRLANDVLEITSVTNQSFLLDEQYFGIDALLHEVISEYQAYASSKGLSLSLETRNLPPSMKGDRQRIKQVVGNLLSNAIKFTEEGRVGVEVEYSENSLRIDVVDTGPGIRMERKHDIFRDFVRLDTGSSQQPGTGLGLAICRRICEAMGGAIWLENSSPAGSRFRISLPLESSDELPDEEHSNRIFNNPKGKVLVVEDHPINQFVAKSLLESMGCSATQARNGEEAIEILRKEKFDLILMDCRMPKLDGYQTTKRIRTVLEIDIPVIAMTANASPQERQACIDAGMNDFLGKPFGRPALHRILCKWLDPKRTVEAAGPAPLDDRMFNDLWSSLGWQAAPLRAIASNFKVTVQKTLDSLDTDDPELIRRNLHTLRGTAGMIGARGVEEVVSKLQQAVRSGEKDRVKQLRLDLARANDAFQTAVTDRLRGKPS